MSEENVEKVRRSLEALASGDVEEMLSYFDPKAELHSAIIGGAEGKVFRGHDGLRRWYAETGEIFEELEIEFAEYRDLGDRIVAFGRIHARGRGSGMEIDSPTGWVFTARGGRVVKAEGFLNRAEALEAAGLLE
jgi:ketosteroid isomerase-like protein